MKFVGWTIEERERYAFAEGLPTAQILSALVDSDPAAFLALEQDHEQLNGKLDDLKVQNLKLKDKLAQVALICAVTR